MAAQVRARREKSDWVGNYIHCVMGNRKSYPRDSQGFENLNAYFPNEPRTSDTDTDSDDNTEELVRQRLLMLTQKRRAKEREKAPSKQHPSLNEDVASPTDKDQEATPAVAVTESPPAVETIQASHLERNVTVTKSKPSVRETTIVKQPTTDHVTQSVSIVTHTHSTSSPTHSTASHMADAHSILTHTHSTSPHTVSTMSKNSEQFYSPNKSVLPSPSPHSKRVLPSRLSFDEHSSSETDSNSKQVPSTDSKKSTVKSKRRKKRSIAMPTKKKVAPPSPVDPSPALVPPTDLAPSQAPPPSDPSPALELDSRSDTGLISFNPPISSTLNPERVVLEATKKKKTGKKQEISSIRPVKHIPFMDSDSSDGESEPDQTLTQLLKGAVGKLHILEAKANKRLKVTQSTLDTTRKPGQSSESRTGEENKSNKEETRGKKPSGKPPGRPPGKPSGRPSGKESKHEKSKTKQKSRKSISAKAPSKSIPTPSPEPMEEEPPLPPPTDPISPSPDPHATPTSAATKPKKALKIRRLSIVLTKTASSPGEATGVLTRSRRAQSDTEETVTSRRKATGRVGMPRTKKGKKQESVVPKEEPVKGRGGRKSTTRHARSQSDTESSASGGDRGKSRSRSVSTDSVSDGSPPSNGGTTGRRGRKRGNSVLGYISDYEINTSQAKSGAASIGGGGMGNPPLPDNDVRGESPTDVSVLPKLTRKRKNHSRNDPPTKRLKNSVTEDTTDTDEDFDLTMSPGGREYRRLKVGSGPPKTPGVRRSQRTRIAPVRPWLNEKVDYDMRRRSGVSIKGLLVPTYEIDDVVVPRRKPSRRKPTAAQEESEPNDDDFENLAITNSSGEEEEWVVVRTMNYGTKLDGDGKEATELSDVVFQRMFYDHSFNYGRISLEPLAMKGRAKNKFHMVFLVTDGRLQFRLEGHDYNVQKGLSVHIPPLCVYSIKNLYRTKASCFYFACTI